ncbi:hypothetical protein FUA22_13970, partial [Seonamhaeicola maritimus]
MEVLVVYRKTLLKLLKQGYNPYQDNTELHNKLNNRKETAKNEVKSEVEAPKEVPATETPKMTIKQAYDFGLKLKEKLVSERTHKDYKNKINTILTWLEKNHPELKTIEALDKKVVSAFLNHILD